MIAALERRTRAELDDDAATHTDYAIAWLESGGTVLSLADALSADIEQPVMRATLSRYLSELDAEWEERGRRARARGSYAMVEDAVQQAEKDHHKDNVPLAKLRVDTKLKVAAMFNRDEFGERKGQTIALNIGALHIGAMRHAAALREGTATAGAIAEEAQVVSIDDATT